MHLHIHDTSKRQKVKFVSRQPDQVGLYVCGPTVYDRIHIGNARPLVVFDVLSRLLRQYYGTVTYVRNITDIDDKINARAKERGIDIRSLTETTVAQFREDCRHLNCLPPDHEPRATETIPEMVSHIEKLIDNGHAYALEDGHVLFHVPSWEDYGRFANKDREEQISGARVEIASHKRDPADFVLWKPSDSETPGWPSPWCEKGRPGWHIECSAMSEKFLGKDFDIHGGGIDLVFPHHQNEIAQSCCVHPPEERKDRYARYWMHNGYLMSEGEKMSKSLGNFYTVSQLLEEFPGEALRLVLLQTHYRQPLDFSRQKCRDARASLDRLYRLKQDLPEVEEVIYDAPFMAALADDLNTPLALARLHELADDTHSEHGVAAFKGALSLLGLAQKDAKVWFKGADDMEGISSVEIDSLISERQAAKQAKDFATADQIRNSLKDQGVILEDKPGGLTEWRRA